MALFKPDVVCTDNYKVYNRGIPNDILVQSKRYTHNIEAQNSSLRDFIKRYNRKTKAYSKASDMAELSVYIHFFCSTIFIYQYLFFGTKVLWLDKSLIPIKPLSPNISTSSGIASITANFLNCLKS